VSRPGLVAPLVSNRRPPGGARGSGLVEDTRPPLRQEPPSSEVIVPKLYTKAKSDPGRIRAKLVYTSVEGLETEFELDDKNTVGRHPKNSIRLHDREVSKEHGTIERRGERYVVRDLESSNGTFVNGKRIRESELKQDDELMFGSMKLTFRAAGTERKGVEAAGRDLVTIIPNEPAGATHVHVTLEDRPEDKDFKPAAEMSDPDTLKQDYEKLRVAYMLSREAVAMDFSALLKKVLEVAFELLPADNAVILLVDPETGMLLPHTIKRRDEADAQEILLSSSIVNNVLQSRQSCLLSNALLDPRFSSAHSIISQGIRSAMCVPLVANETVYGVMHIDSRQRIGAFTEKDLSLLKALANQAASAIANSRLIRKIEEDAKANAQLSRFLPPHVVEQMVGGRGQAITKGGRECDATVLFCDIRGFTSMSEAAGEPQEIVALLNDYFERLVEIVFNRHGVLDKFIGDALMAHWGTLPGDEDPVFSAVQAAVEFRDAIRAFNVEREAEGRPPIGMGVGVNTGRLVAGYMGSRRRLEYTVIGDTVNTASRICGLAGPDQVLISESTHRLVEDRITAEYLGSKQVKGKETSVEIYQVNSVTEGRVSDTRS
jgi:adenylate cyclase